MKKEYGPVGDHQLANYFNNSRRGNIMVLSEFFFFGIEIIFATCFFFQESEDCYDKTVKKKAKKTRDLFFR